MIYKNLFQVVTYSLAFIVITYAQPSNILLANGSHAPDFKLKEANGNDFTLSNTKGKIVVLDFWGTWCSPCKKAMPHIQSIHKKFSDSPVEVIGISVHDAEGKPQKYMKENGYTYKLLLNGEKIVKSYKVRNYPTVYLIDKNGIIIYSKIGLKRSFEKELSKKIKEQLAL